jgi:hypothetical protein
MAPPNSRLRSFVFESQGQAIPNFAGNFVALWSAYKIKTKAFAETDKDRHHKRAYMIAREMSDLP